MNNHIKMTKEEWLAKGKEIFGEVFFKWKFICPGCGHIQAVEDFRPYKEQGASPDSAHCECIGRYSGGKSWLNDNPKKKGGPCDYAAYGLITISPITVIDGEEEKRCFAFAEAN